MGLNGDIVKAYLEEFPDSPSLTLARMIYEENKAVFTSVEAVRSIVRTYRGANGDTHRQNLKDRRFIREFKKDFLNPYSLPDSDEKEFEPFVIPKVNNKILVLSDVHVPYHSIEALTAAIEYGKAEKINTILLNGDIFDFHKMSRFDKDPRNRNFKEEIEIAHLFLDSLQNEFPNAKIYMKQGNHEYRLESYLKVKAPELFGMPEFELDVLLKFGSRGIGYIKDKRTIKAGKLNILHGHELTGGMIPPVNVARGIFLRTYTSTMVGHFHRTSHHQEKSIDGDLVSCWSTGCLCEVNPEWMPNNRWNHGFAVIDVKDSGKYSVDNIIIDKGEVYKG